MRNSELDWDLIGRNVRHGRLIRGHSQDEFARRTGLSITTIYHVERGLTISRRSLLKICESLEESFDGIRTRRRSLLTSEVGHVLFRRPQSVWTAEIDLRTKVPEDNLERLQDPRERLRLGRLALVPAFFCTTSFIMPQGPGMMFVELYSRLEDPINSIIYREALIHVTRGQVRLRIADETIELGEGDVVGYRSRELVWMEPTDPTDLPVLLVWTGAVRVGAHPVDPGRNARVKRRPKVPAQDLG